MTQNPFTFVLDSRVLPVFELASPTSCPNVPNEILNPKQTWADGAAYDDTASKLASKFVEIQLFYFFEVIR